MQQGRVIENLNKYLKWNNLPIRMNQRGICNGIAAVYVKYFLEGRQDEFEQMLRQIAVMHGDAKLDSRVNHFATEIVLSFSHQFYDKKFNQYNSVEALQIDGKGLKSSFDLGLVTTGQNWSEIIKGIALRDDEAMMVSSIDHAIAINKKNGVYVVYGPNYKSGFKTFSTEQLLMTELYQNVFRYRNGQLGLSLRVIRHPSNNTPREFPDVETLHRQYLMPNEAVTNKGRKIDSLDIAIELDSNEAINELFTKGLKDEASVYSAVKAITFNSPNALSNLLTRIPKIDETDHQKLFTMALLRGGKESFDALLKNDQCKIWFNERLLLKKNAQYFIKSAVFGGNVELLKEIIEFYKTQGKPSQLSDREIAACVCFKETYGFNSRSDSINLAIQAGSAPSVKLLLEQLDKADIKLNEEQLLIYLHQSIKQNKPQLVELFLEKAQTSLSQEDQKYLFKSIKLNLNTVERTDLSILRTLKIFGVQFSKNAECLIDKKEKQPTGYLLSIGVMLNRFTDFIKECLPRYNEARDSITNFHELKSRATEARESLAKKTNNEPTVEPISERAIIGSGVGRPK